MKYNLWINICFAHKHNLNLQEATLFSYIADLPKWSEVFHVENGKVYHWFAYSHYSKQIPLVSQKRNTIYKQVQALQQKGLIEAYNAPQRKYLRLSDIGKGWILKQNDRAEINQRSDFNKPEGGNNSTLPSEINQPNNNNSDNDIVNKNTFSDFWANWPGIDPKGSKPYAEKEYKKACNQWIKENQPESTEEDFLVLLTVSAKQQQIIKTNLRDTGQFCASFPHVHTWIKREGWEESESSAIVKRAKREKMSFMQLMNDKTIKM